MYFEWPEFRRCCLCMPLRRGILVFGYANLILTIFQVILLHMIDVDNMLVMPLRRANFQLPVIFTIVLCALELIADIVLIYGTHVKKPLYIKIYYYFMVSMLLASVFLEILSAAMSRNDGAFVIYFLLCLVFNLYLLFLVRSLIHKLQVSGNNKFSNQLADFIDGSPVRDGDVYPEIVVPRETETV